MAKKGEIKTNLDRQIDRQEMFLALQRDPDDDGGFLVSWREVVLSTETQTQIDLVS